KTGGCRFESCRPCSFRHAESGGLAAGSERLFVPPLYRLKPLETARDWRPLARNWRAPGGRRSAAVHAYGVSQPSSGPTTHSQARASALITVFAFFPRTTPCAGSLVVG